ANSLIGRISIEGARNTTAAQVGGKPAIQRSSWRRPGRRARSALAFFRRFHSHSSTRNSSATAPVNHEAIQRSRRPVFICLSCRVGGYVENLGLGICVCSLLPPGRERGWKRSFAKHTSAVGIGAPCKAR